MIISKDAIKNILNRILKLDKKVDSHKHNISDVNNLQTTLDKKAPIDYVSQFEGGAISSNFRKTIIGTTDMCGFAKSFRKNDSTDACMPQHGSGIAWGQADTHGMLYVDYSKSTAYVAGGNGNRLNWYKQIAWKDDLANYSLTTHNHDTVYSKLNTTSTLMFAGYVTNANGIVTTDYNYNSCCSTVTASANSSQKVLEFVAPVKGVYLFLVRCTGANGSNNNYTIHVGGYSYSNTAVTSSQDQSGYTERKMNKGESTYVCYWSSSYYYGVTGEVTILRLSVS